MPTKIKKIRSIQDIAAFCKKRGFIFPSGEIYGGFAGFWDYGPIGVELKENIKRSWWKRFVQSRKDIIGIDGAIITHPKTWLASGHIASFKDAFVNCKKCERSYRLDHLIEEKTQKSVEGLSLKELTDLLKKYKLFCSECGGSFDKPIQISLMMETGIGPGKSTTVYLRPETAQLIFTNFKLVLDSARMKLPFGIAQMGKGFRNEISPREFIFRDREFDMMEIEYFVHPDKLTYCPYLKNIENLKINLMLKDKVRLSTIGQLANKLKNKWLAYWLGEQYKWFLDMGIDPKNLRLREHTKEELAHYATACYDIEYNFPFGWRELQGMADRGQFDLKAHMKASGADLMYFDEEDGKKVIPCVAAEPSQGVERAFLAFLLDAYTIEKVDKEDRVVLKLNEKLAPVQVGIFPLLKKGGLPKKASSVYNILKDRYTVFYDERGSIGKRYRRMDEIGCPMCITIDHQTLEDNTVTIRDRDTMKQRRVNISKIVI